MEPRRLLSVYTVTNTSGDRTVAGSLPWAVFQATYATKGLDYINFRIPGSGPFVIDVTAPLYFNEQVVVDATTQPGYAGSPLVTVRGNANIPSVFALTPGSSGSTIQGFAITNYTANAIAILPGSDGDWIQSNWLGFYVDASNKVHRNSDLFDGSSGIGLQTNNSVVRWNTISGTYAGVILLNGNETADGAGAVYKGNAIQYNYVGTDPTGSTSANFGNTHTGVFLGSGAQNNYVGPGNVISGNAVNGVEMLNRTSAGNVVFGNLIGTNATGAYAIPNNVGVLMANGVRGNLVGGSWGGNVISGNHLGGIALGDIDYPGATGNLVQGNIIGLNAGQSAIIPGQNAGVTIQYGATSNSVTSNAIAGSTTNGVVIASATSNYVGYNYIGLSGYGAPFPNGAFGVAFVSGANYNWLVGNAYGPNTYGKAYIDSTSVGNYVPDLVAAAAANQSVKRNSIQTS